MSGRTHRTLVSSALALAVGTCGFVARADPPTKIECSASHAKSQELRLDGKLVEARVELRVCADPACPSALQTECASWLAEVQQAIPSVVFLFETAPDERQKVRVMLDRATLDAAVDGEAHELNPGAHAFRFELEGHPAQEQTVVIRQGEKRRVVGVDFREQAPPSAPTPADKPAPAAPPSAVQGEPAVGTRPVPAITYVFGGMALAAAGVGAYLSLDAMSTYRDKKDSCAPNCSDDDVSQLKTQLLVADLAGGVALVSAGLAVISYLNRPMIAGERPPSGAGPVRVLVAPNTVAVRFSGAF